MNPINIKRFLRISIPIVFILFTVMIWFLLFKTQLFAKTLEEYYDNGKIHFKKNVDDKNFLHGWTREYFKSGKLKSERMYEHGYLHGISRLYYPTGELMTEWKYKEGKRNGISLGYYKSGTLKDKGFYKEDLLNGNVKMFFPNGKIKTELNFIDDRQEGRGTTYFPNGQIQFIYFYKKGHLIYRESYNEKGRFIKKQEFRKPSTFP